MEFNSSHAAVIWDIKWSIWGNQTDTTRHIWGGNRQPDKGRPRRLVYIGHHIIALFYNRPSRFYVTPIDSLTGILTG